MQAGDKIEVLTKISRGWRRKEYKYLSETEKTILVTNGMYRETINKFDIKCKRTKIRVLEDKVMNNKEAKITREQLLEECRKLGTSKAARDTIAAKYGLTEGTIQNYIYKRWRIMDELNKKQSENNSEVISSKEGNVEEKASGTIKEFGSIENAVDIIKNVKPIENTLKILSATIEGKNGTYKVCEKGVELTNKDATMFFENPKQVDEFAAEYKAVFTKVSI